MTFQDVFGMIAGFVSALAFVPYIRSIYQGKTRPHRVTWFVWLIVGVIICASYKTLGATSSAWVTYIYVAGPLVVFIISCTKCGIGGWDIFDILCLSGALLGAFLWWKYNSPLTALQMNIAMDFLGLLPTLRKMRHQPETENLVGWIIATLSALINLFSVEDWSEAKAMYPVYAVLAFGGATTYLWLRTRHKKAMEQTTSDNPAT